jgi:SAM-dependent methyltransferase
VTVDKRMADEPDVGRPNSARMYDYFLGGAQNFAVDRDVAEQAAVAFPHIRLGARVNRSFLGRAVSYLVAQGVDQFLDLGSGIPTVGNVHEIAHRHNPAARVAYVDYEPVAVAHARRLLAGDDRVSITHADIRVPEPVLAEVGKTLDFDRPVAVLAMAILHFLPDDDDPYGMLAGYRNACAPGSYLAISHGSQVTLTDEQISRFLRAYARTPTPALFRTVEEIRPLLAGYELVEPGLVPLPQWRPAEPVADAEAAEANIYGGIGKLI